MVKTNNNGGLQMNTIKGRCIEAGDDAEGQPRIIIHTTREELRDGPAIVMKEVCVSAEEPIDWKARAMSAENKLSELEEHHAWSISPAMAEAKIEELSKRAEQAEKACAERRDALCEAETFMNFGVAPDFEAKILAKIQNALKCDCGRSYISITDPVIVGLVDSLNNIQRNKGLLSGERAALADYDARKKEAGL
jgi:hypothetical protein